MWKPEIRLALILLKTPQSKHNGVVSYVFICYREWLSNNNRKQSNSNRTQSNSNRTQSNKITQSNAIETNQRFPVMFDWCSIVFGNRTSIVRLGSIDFDFSIEKSGSIVFDWHRLDLTPEISSQELNNGDKMPPLLLPPALSLIILFL